MQELFMFYILRNSQSKFFFFPYAIKILEFKTYKPVILPVYLLEFKTSNFIFSKVHKMKAHEKENVDRKYRSTIQGFPQLDT